MASGAEHDLHGLMIASGILCLVTVLIGGGHLPLNTLALPFGVAFGTLCLSPDMDMANTRPYRRWLFLRHLWGPYAAMFSHRGLSHSLLVGPATRLIYLALLVSPVAWYLGYTPDSGLLFFSCGVFLANAIHLWGDGILWKG